MIVRRAVVCLVGAVAAHAAVVAVIVRVRVPAAETAQVVETEIDVVASEAAPAAASVETPTAAPAIAPAATTAVAAATNVKVNSLSLSAGAGAAGGGGEAPAAEPSPASSATGAPVQLFAVGPADIGVAGSSGGGNPFLPKRDEAPPSDGKNALRDAFRARDTALGLGPEGPVVSALRDAAYGSASPVNGRAIFEVHAGEGGIITILDVVSGEGGSWSDAQRVAQERLASVKIVLPRGAKAAVFRIEVTSKWAMPAATTFGTRAAEGNDGPALTFPDPSNIGAKPRRVVRAHVVGAHVE